MPADADGLDDDCAGEDRAEGDECAEEDGTGDDGRALELPVRHCQ